MTPPDTPSPNKRGRPQTDSTSAPLEGVVATGAVAPRQMPEQLNAPTPAVSREAHARGLTRRRCDKWYGPSARRVHRARDLH